MQDLFANPAALSVLFKQFLHPTILDRARHDGIHHKKRRTQVEGSLGGSSTHDCPEVRRAVTYCSYDIREETWKRTAKFSNVLIL